MVGMTTHSTAAASKSSCVLGSVCQSGVIRTRTALQVCAPSLCGASVRVWVQLAKGLSVAVLCRLYWVGMLL